MTLLECYARPRRLIEIFVLRLKGFQLIEQLKDQIAIILYQPEPAILRSKFSVGSGSGTRAPCRTRRSRPFCPHWLSSRDFAPSSRLLGGREGSAKISQKIEGLNTNALRVSGRATGATGCRAESCQERVLLWAVVVPGHLAAAVLVLVPCRGRSEFGFGLSFSYIRSLLPLSTMISSRRSPETTLYGSVTRSPKIDRKLLARNGPRTIIRALQELHPQLLLYSTQEPIGCP
jgi:hypothetical protein